MIRMLLGFPKAGAEFTAFACDMLGLCHNSQFDKRHRPSPTANVTTPTPSSPG
jgi:hypothetical protein